MSKIGIIKNIAIFALGNPYKSIEKSIEKVSVEDTEKLNEIYKEICVFDMVNPKGKKCIKPELYQTYIDNGYVHGKLRKL